MLFIHGGETDMISPSIMEAINLIDWIFEGIANWIASVVSSMMDSVSAIFLDVLSTDMTAMEEYFPFITKAFDIMQYFAWALLFIITVWQLFRAFGGPITEAENPWHLLVRSTIFSVLIGYARPIFSIALDIARAPYTALMDVSMNAGDFTFAGIENVLVSGIVTVVSTLSIVGLLLQIILLVALGWNYFKLLMETVERYIVVGVLCYTSPLAFCMGGAKATNRVFQSWCRMVGSQLLLLVMNVWFLRAFNSSVGHFVANGGALTSGRGNIFLWMFCALAFLKTAQKFDSYLASLGLSVAQTGGNMGMELMMGMRVISGITGGFRSAGSVFKSMGTSGAPPAGSIPGPGGNASGAASFMSGLASKFKGNSYVRDAVTDGGARLGAGGGIGLVGRAFGGIAARTGVNLSGESISSVATRPPAVSGSIAGEIADRSLKNYMPHLAGAADSSGMANPAGMVKPTGGVDIDAVYPAAGSAGTPDHISDAAGAAPVGYGATGGMVTGVASYSDTQITGGHISTTAITADGKEASVDLYNASLFDKPNAPHSIVSASDGSQWYQTASGDGMGAFYSTPNFTGSSSEAAQVAETFPGTPDGTMLRTVDNGVLEASHPELGSSMWYNSAFFQEPDAPHDTIQSADGVGWYAMQPHAETPYFESSAGISGSGTGEMPHSGVSVSGAGSGAAASGGLSKAAMEYNQSLFQNFMPGYEQQTARVDAARHRDGMIEVRHADGSGTAFYDKTMFQSPHGDYKVYEDRKGGQWYAIPGSPTVERRPVYENGKPVYDGDKLRTVNVENIRYKTTLTKFEAPSKRDVNDRGKPPNLKRR